MWGLQETMVILGTSQPSSTPPHLYPFGMPQGGSVKHSLHHSDSNLPQIPSGLLHCVIPYSLPTVFSQGLADSTVLQLPSHTTKGWTHILKYTALKIKNIRTKRGSGDVVPCTPQKASFKTAICVFAFLVAMSKELLRISLCRLPWIPILVTKGLLQLLAKSQKSLQRLSCNICV